MRLLVRYKIHKNRVGSSWKLPTRVKSFKKPRWEGIKRKFWIKKWGIKKWVRSRSQVRRKIKYRIRTRFFNHIRISVRKKYYGKKFFRFKQGLKRYVSSLFENRMKLKRNLKIKDRHSVVCSFLVKPFYRIDILLWYLDFFHSSIEATTFIQGGNVLVNKKIVGANYEVKEGDIVHFNDNLDAEKRLSFRNLRFRYKKTSHFFPFFEYDFYTRSIVVLKGWKEVTGNEMSLVLKKGPKLKYVSYR